MKVTLWGTRGSIPVANSVQSQQQKIRRILERAIAQKVHHYDQIEDFVRTLPFALGQTFGGNTSCVEVQHSGDEYMLCDFGTGIRDFANKGIKNRTEGNTFHVFISHLHWDHIMGFPFFNPAYIPGNTIHIYICHPQAKSTFEAQHASPNFPVKFEQLQADIQFHTMKPGVAESINGFNVVAKLQQHQDDSFAYRFEQNNQIVVYSTDSEHKAEDGAEAERFVEFFRDADLVIFDAMYSLIDAITLKEDWGHSSNLTGVELCQRANVKHLCLFHHDPIHSDQQIEDTLIQARQFEQITRIDEPLIVTAAYDGQRIQI